MSRLCSLQCNVIKEYSTYAADWRYAGIQLLFITAKPRRFIYPDWLSQRDLADSTLLCTWAHSADLPTALSARQKTGDTDKMRRGLLLVTFFLVMEFRYSRCRCDEPGSRRSTSDTIGLENFKRNILKRYNDLDYDSFVGLMGRRSAEPDAEQPPQKREMDDIFIGLMGRRNAETDNGPWRREYPERRGIFLNKCRLRLLQGL
ncbi:unnamed protein product [Oreochromis niloticus]|nr:unnamed protein product [Mustela putorius furo]